MELDHYMPITLKFNPKTHGFIIVIIIFGGEGEGGWGKAREIF